MTPNGSPLSVRDSEIPLGFDTLNYCAVVPDYMPVATVQ